MLLTNPGSRTTKTSVHFGSYSREKRAKGGKWTSHCPKHVYKRRKWCLFCLRVAFCRATESNREPSFKVALDWAEIPDTCRTSATHRVRIMTNSNMLYRNHILHHDKQSSQVSDRFFQRFGEIVSNPPQRAAKLPDQIKHDTFLPERKHSWVSQLAPTRQDGADARRVVPLAVTLLAIYVLAENYISLQFMQG